MRKVFFAFIIMMGCARIGSAQTTVFTTSIGDFLLKKTEGQGCCGPITTEKLLLGGTEVNIDPPKDGNQCSDCAYKIMDVTAPRDKSSFTVTVDAGPGSFTYYVKYIWNPNRRVYSREINK